MAVSKHLEPILGMIRNREYEPDDFQLQLRVFSPSLTLQVYKTGSWSSE